MADPASVLAWAPTPVVAPPPPTPSDIIDVGGAASLPTTPVAANANVPGGITLHADPGDAVAASWAGKTVGVNNPYSLPDSIRSQIPAGTKYPFVINVAPLPQPATVAVVPDTASPQAAAAAAPVVAAPPSSPPAKPDPMARLLAAEAAAKVANAAPVPVQVTAQRRAAIPTVPTTSSPGLPAPTPEQQQAFAAEQAQDQKQTGIIPNAMAGVNAAIAGTAGLPVDLTTGIANLGIAGINAATSANAPLIQNPVGGSAWISHAMGLIGADPNQVAAATPEEQLVRAAASGATSAVLPMGIGGQMARAANPIIAGVGRTLAEAPTIPTAASGALASVGGTVATDAAQHAGVPAQYLPYIDMAAQLAAGGAGALATGGVLAGTKMAQATGARFADTFDRGAQAPLLDAAGQPLLDAQGQPVAATQRMASRAANALVAKGGASPDALSSQVDQHVGEATGAPGGLTTGQMIGNTGLLQAERELKTSRADIKQQFNQREADQNASQLARIKSLGPNEAPAAAAGHYFVNRLNQIDATEAALVAKARAVYESELANHGGAESPSDTGAAMAAHVNAAHAPAEALAEGAVQMVRAKVDAAAKAAGGERADIPGGKNARQQYSETLQEQLEAIRQEANKQRHDLYEARDPEGKLALSVAPFKAAAKEIRASVEPGVDEELSPKLTKLLDDVDALPEVTKAGTLAKFRVRVNAALAEAQRGMVAGKDGAANDARLMGKLKAAIDQSEAEATERAAAGDHVKAEAGAQPQETVVGRLAQHVADGSTPSAGTAVYTPSGRRIDVKYKVVETSTLKGSHNADLSVNRNFPAELQPRDRTRAASETQVQRMAGGLQPERLGASASAMDGAPIVGPDGVVESGNARYLALRRAYQAHPDSAQAYRDFLKSQGYDTTGMKEPVLVRERQTPMTEGERIKFTQEANASSGLAMSAAERAKVDAQRMPASMFDLWRPGEVDSAANRDFVRAFVKNVAEKGEEGNFITAEGGISLEGAQRIRNALLQRAYGDSNLVSALAETGDDNIKAFGGALADVAGDFAKLREAIAKGDVDPAMDISPQLLDAAKMISQARVRKISLGDLLNQKDVFSPQIDPLTEKTLRAAYGENLTGRMSRERMAKLLTFYADEAGKQTTTSRLFEENLKPGDILARGQTRDISGQTTRAVRAPSSSGYGPSVSAVGAGGEQSAARAEREAVAEPVAAAEQAPLTENLTAEDAARFRAADAFNREYKSRFGATTPAGKAVARSYGDFKMALSDVASNFWRSGSKGAESLENLKAAFGSDEAAEKAIGDYAAYDLRAFSKKGDGLDAGKLRKWMDDHAAALNQFPALRDRFNTLTKAQAQLDGIQAQRDALNALNPVRGQSGADTLGQFVKAGPKGGEAVDAYLKHAGNTPEARQALEDGFAYSLRASAMKDGELDPKAYAAWRARFSPALDRVPETAAKFDGLATARNAVDEAAERAAEQRKAYVNSVASHYLTKGGEPVEPQVAIKSIIASETAPADVAKILAEMKGDKDAVAGLRQGFADYLVNLVRNSAESGVSGEYQVSMAKLQRVVNDPKLMATLGKVFTQDQLETLKSVASDAQKAARSYTATGINGSPGSAADLNATHSVDPHQDVSGVVLTEALGRGAGEVLRASSGVKSILEVGALLSRIWADRASTATRAKQQDLMAQALLHPEVFRALMTAARQPVVRPGVLTRLKGLVSNLAISGATAPAVPQFKGQQ